MNKKSIYPGTFDPITFGHIDIIKRAAEIFDNLVIAVAKDNNKNPLFSLSERVEITKIEVAKIDSECKIEVREFQGLLVDFVKNSGAKVIIRGLRAVSDFEYEFQMFGMNSKLNPQIQTIFLPASENHHFIASKMVKEVARLGGKIDDFVSQDVAQILYKKLQKENERN